MIYYILSIILYYIILYYSFIDIYIYIQTQTPQWNLVYYWFIKHQHYNVSKGESIKHDISWIGIQSRRQFLTQNCRRSTRCCPILAGENWLKTRWKTARFNLTPKKGFSNQHHVKLIGISPTNNGKLTRCF